MDNLTFLKEKIKALKPADQVKLYEYVLRASTIDNMLSKRKKQPEGMADLDELYGDGEWLNTL